MGPRIAIELERSGFDLEFVRAEELRADEIRPFPRRADDGGRAPKTCPHAELFLRLRSSVFLVARANDDRS